MVRPIEFTQWITHVQSPRVEGMLKAAADSDAISFAGGLPAEELFPAEALSAAFEKVLRERAGEALQYAWSEGCEPLRRQIASLMRLRGVEVSPDEIVITHGAQQALDLLAKLAVPPGEGVALESPTYVPAIQTFELQHAQLSPISRTASHWDEAALTAAVANPAIRLLYLVPNGHNPTGGRVAPDPGARAVEACLQAGKVLVEDGAYAEIQYEGPAHALRAHTSARDCVAYVGSFSKVLSPGLRVGWIAAPPALTQQLSLIKQASDLQTGTLTQWVLSTFLENTDYRAHIERCVAFYRSRRAAMLESLEKHLPSEVRWAPPAGGFSVWLELPTHVRVESLLKDALNRGVAFEPGGPFFPGQRRDNFVRLSFSNLPEERIRDGIQRFADLLKTTLRVT